MTRPLRPALIALAFIALAGSARAEAQRSGGASLPPSVSSVTTTPESDVAPHDPAVLRTAAGPTLPPPTSVTRAAEAGHRAAAPAIVQGDRGFPTTRVLMIGGAALAVGGLFIGGDAGAIVSLTGATAAILGLYLHYR